MELARLPGRRVPRTVDPDELAVRAVLGQQVSTAAARTHAARLVIAHGEPIVDPRGDLTHLFPTPAALAERDPSCSRQCFEWRRSWSQTESCATRLLRCCSRSAGATVRAVAGDDASPIEGVVDLLGGSGIGPLWGMASHDLNATLLAWPPRHELVEHVNAQLDVLVIVLDGDGKVLIDGETHDLAAGSAILIPRATRRRITAGHRGLRYISVHRRRGPLQIQTPADR